MCVDCDRLAFVEQRDGSAEVFARQCVQQYRKACLTMKNGRRFWGRDFRRRFVQGYKVARSYLAQKEPGDE